MPASGFETNEVKLDDAENLQEATQPRLPCKIQPPTLMAAHEWKARVGQRKDELAASIRVWMHTSFWQVTAFRAAKDKDEQEAKKPKTEGPQSLGLGLADNSCL